MATIAPTSAPLARARRWGATALRARIAGAQAQARAERIWGTPGPRWFTPEDPIWRVHADASMFAGGIRALLLQSLHPIALTGVEEHSDYRSDPWSRVQNTSEFIAATTFGTVAHAEEVIARVRRIHGAVNGTMPDGTAYAADDPHLLRWVHVAEVESFLTTYQRFGGAPLTQPDADTYVAQTAVAAERLGVVDPPTTEAGLRADIEAFRPELEGTVAARRVARFLLLDPPLPLPARPAYGVLAAGALATLPQWALTMLDLPAPVRLAARVGGPLGHGATSTVRWLMSDPSVSRPAPDAG